MSFARLAFWIGLAALAHLYVLYPLSLLLLARLRPRPVRKGIYRPSLSLVIPAHCEQQCIETKLRDSLALEYPRERLEILVASDGSTDATVERARRFAADHPDHRVEVLDLPRGGKAETLNRAVEAATGEILVFTDANSELVPEALVAITDCFADPEVGGVAGAKSYRVAREGDSTQVGEGLYWRLDQWQKRMETRIGSVFAADGTLHAIRRELYVPLADPAQADDIAISARVVLQGYRLVFEPRARAIETAPGDGGDELQRKIRVTNHSMRALLGLGRALWSRGLYSYELVSHKLLRHLSPFFVLLLALGSVLLAPRSLLAAGVLLGLALLALAAAAGALGRRRAWSRHRLFTLPYYFALVNLAALIGVCSVALGVRRARWSPRGGLSTRGSST